jgi:hypothetical protein
MAALYGFKLHACPITLLALSQRGHSLPLHISTPTQQQQHQGKQDEGSAMSWLPSFSAGLDADILLYGEDERKIVEVKGEKEGRKETCPVYYDGESVKGQVSYT